MAEGHKGYRMNEETRKQIETYLLEAFLTKLQIALLTDVTTREVDEVMMTMDIPDNTVDEQ